MEQVIETKQCRQCGNTFPITDEDIQFYDQVSPVIGGIKYSVPIPAICPTCRLNRRLSWSNERNLYHRKCAATGKNILSVFAPETPYVVYDNDYWYGDEWDGRDYGMEFDFNKSFFEQFNELLKKVPSAQSVVGNTNSDFVNSCGWSKNCYLIFEADGNENCYYANDLYDSRSSMDLLFATNCELCYENVDCRNSYDLKYSQDCDNCHTSMFLNNCIGCSNCFGCVNLRNKKYCIFNQEYSEEEYKEKIKEMNIGSFIALKKFKEDFKQFALQFPRKYMQGTQNENSTGYSLYNTKNCQCCFDIQNSQDSKYIERCRNMRHCYDILVFGAAKGADFCYESHDIGDGGRNLLFCFRSWGGCSNLIYCKLCINSSHDLFGCISLKHREYCILNKQYTKGEYEELVPKIIEHMKKTGEWGEFFPISLSPFGYNETISVDYNPLTKEQALSQGYRWREDDQKQYQKQTYIIPDTISEVSDNILQEILACESCGKNFKIMALELEFYRKSNIPLPHNCPNCRHKVRMQMRNPYRLWDRQCMKCNADIKTSYSPERREIVYCEKCYRETVY